MTAADPDRIARARRLLARLGVDPAEMLPPDTGPIRPMPTIGEFLPRVRAAATPAMIRSYGTYWSRLATGWGERRLDDIAATDILAWMHQLRTSARRRRAGRHGRYAAMQGLGALRALYRLAVADGLLNVDRNPAKRVRMPRRKPSARHALAAREVAAINQVVATTGRDTALDCLLMRLHTETACRRGGAVGMRLEDLDTESCLIRLHEKGGTVRWQPISPTLTAALARHAQLRGADAPGDQLLRYATGSPLTYRRYDTLWKRVHDRLPWAAARGVSTHWLRHTTITWVERHFGYGVARAYAGHTDTRGASTTTYIRSLLPEIATALTAYTGEPHPLAGPL